MKQRIYKPSNMFDSWKLRKLSYWHGPRMAERAYFAELRMTRMCRKRGAGNYVPYTWAMGLARAGSHADRRTLLGSMVQCNILRKVRGGYRVLSLAVYVHRKPLTLLAGVQENP